MADNTTIVDHILKEEGQGRYSVYFKDLTNEDKESIQDWLKDNIEYNDIQKAPVLPDNNKAYNTHTENEEVIRDEIKPFNITAFTGDYNDLANAPTIPMVNGTRPTIFNEIAFTGNINSSNLKVSNVLDFTQYSADLTNIAGLTQLENTENNDKFKSIGGSDVYIKGLNQFVKNTDKFIDILSSYLTTFIEDKKPTFFRSNSGIFFITDVDVVWTGPVTNYYQVHLINIVNSNYALAREISGATEAEILENIELTAKNVMLIFDLDNNLIYCKTQEINNQSEEEVEPYEEIDPIFTASPAANITNQDITNWNNKSEFDETALAAIALSGDYNDLSNQPTIINNILFFSTIPCIDNNFKNLTSSSIIDATINFDITEDSETIEDWLENISNIYFNNINQLIKIISINNIYIIGNIVLTNNVYTFSFLPLSTTNYSSIDKTNKTDSEILALIQSATNYKQIVLDKDIHKIFIL